MTYVDYLLPVVDLKDGQVVRGEGGQRDLYAPIVSQVVDTPCPQQVGRGLCNLLGSNELYVADLDAIAGGRPAWPVLDELADSGIQLWVDAGIVDLPGGEHLLESVPTCRWIVALESLPSLDLLSGFPSSLRGKVVFSLDLCEGKPLTPFANKRTPMAIAQLAIDAGIQTIIALDLAAVGSGRGPMTLTLCAELKTRYPDITLVSGGGVRERKDVVRFVEHGCDRVLIASALHDGTLGPFDL